MAPQQLCEEEMIIEGQTTFCIRLKNHDEECMWAFDKGTWRNRT